MTTEFQSTDTIYMTPTEALDELSASDSDESSDDGDMGGRQVTAFGQMFESGRIASTANKGPLLAPTPTHQAGRPPFPRGNSVSEVRTLPPFGATTSLSKATPLSSVAFPTHTTLLRWHLDEKSYFFWRFALQHT